MAALPDGGEFPPVTIAAAAVAAAAAAVLKGIAHMSSVGIGLKDRVLHQLHRRRRSRACGSSVCL